MASNNFPVQQALKVIDGPLANELRFERIEGTERTKAHFFKLAADGRQFAVIVGARDESTGRFPTQQTRVLLEKGPGLMPDVEPIPALYNGATVQRSFSRLRPPNQFSVLVASETGLRRLLEWYATTPLTSASDAIVPTPRDGPVRPIPQIRKPSSMQATNTILYGPPGSCP